jgi:IS4 transposase
MRLCALRKTQAATDVARRHARYERARKGGTVREETLEFAAYICVLSSLPKEIISAKEVLALYRCRWQIELAFKRLKSLLSTGHLPKKDPESCRAWMQAKVLIALLTDRLILESELFSPWGYQLR